MIHCSDEDLVLHYYGERISDERHLADCGDCAARYHELRSSLQLLTAVDVPERGEHYGLEVWQNIRHRLPDPQPRWHWMLTRWQWPALATAALVLIVAGFAAGRLWPPAPAPEAVIQRASDDDEAMRRRVLLLTVADHLERSERVLTDIVNASAGSDISTEQAWAGDLLAASRLYRQDAIHTNEASVAAVLDDVERTLLEIVHRPSLATDADLDAMRRRIDSAALLFKVRVMSSDLRQRELAEPATHVPSTTTRSRIG